MIDWFTKGFHNKNVTFNVASYNLCNAQEYADRLFRTPKCIADKFLTATDQEINDLGKKLLAAPEGQSLDSSKYFTTREKLLISDYATMEYTRIGKRCLSELHNQYQPELICMQEASFKHDEKIDLFNQLQYEYGYNLIANGVKGKKLDASTGCMIAYDPKIFKKNNEAFITQGNALCQDLIHLASKKLIRVISDHCEGFNVTAYRKSPGERIPESGDTQLAETLSKIDELLPDVIIYCLDSNTTICGTGNDLHPARLKKLSDRKFITDETDMTPTIRDANTNEFFKFDYIFAKGVAKNHIKIKSLPTNFLEIHMSDHSPIVSKVGIS